MRTLLLFIIPNIIFMHLIVYHQQYHSPPSSSILFGSLCSESRSQIAPEEEDNVVYPIAIMYKGNVQKKNWDESVRLTDWVDPPPMNRSGKCEIFLL